MNFNFREEFRIWRKSRFGYIGLQWLALFVFFTALRLVLFFSFKPAAAFSFGQYAQVFLVGLHLDICVATVLVLPLLVILSLAPERWFRRGWFRFFMRGFCFFAWFIQLFLLCSEYFFFDEFKSRFNTVAIDYLLYPHEVINNIRETYPLFSILTVCVILAALFIYLAEKAAPLVWTMPVGRKIRSLHLFFVGGLAALLVATSSFQEFHVSNERVLNEIANNGAVSVLNAAWTRNLDYTAFYPSAGRSEAFARSRQLLQEPVAHFVDTTNSLQRSIDGDTNRPRLNIVIFLEESLGSEFWGSLGRPGPTLTPRMDELAVREGMLFENMYATGNRTVRGFEGVLSSFPPLPGDSIVKRDRSQNVETIARVLQRDGYATMFLYGGRGIFDGMRSFAINNGYERFIEQKDFPNPTFTTAWGVCNEDLYQRTLTEMAALSKKDKPFFATVLSVSNHRPYTYPPGRIPEDPKKQWRDHAVKYTDWALGQFFDAAKKESFYTNTIFVVVADHGARVYGSQSIPIHSYEIPFVVLGPAIVKNPSRVSILGCQLDVTPTILGLLGRPYDSVFYGKNLLALPPAAGRVLINHNREIGMFRDNRMVVFSMNKRVEFYRGNPKNDTLIKNDLPDAADRELERDATALFETADDLYMNRRYRVTPQPLK